MRAREFDFAKVLAIMPRPPAKDLEGEESVVFLAEGGEETEWPTDALHFDTMEEAERVLANLPKRTYRNATYPMVVRVTISCKVEKTPRPFSERGVIK